MRSPCTTREQLLLATTRESLSAAVKTQHSQKQGINKYLKKKRGNLYPLPKDWCWSWNSNTLANWWEERTYLKRSCCWESLKAGEEDDRGWDGWMASPTRWTRVWTSLGAGDGLGSLECYSPWDHRVRLDWATEVNWRGYLKKIQWFLFSLYCLFGYWWFISLQLTYKYMSYMFEPYDALMHIESGPDMYINWDYYKNSQKKYRAQW